MGDWCVTDHFVLGGRPTPKPSWIDPDAWAMRAGVVAPGIVLMQTVEKWGGQRLAEDGVVGMCGPHDYLAGNAPTSFFAGWNYLLAPSGSDADLFRSVADALGDDARLETQARQRILCLRDALALGAARQTLKVAAAPYLDDPVAKLIGALVQHERSLRGRDTALVCGLWTVEHGFVHTGRVMLALSRAREDHATITATAEHNVLAASWQGPLAGLAWLPDHQKPVRVALERWPFDPR